MLVKLLRVFKKFIRQFFQKDFISQGRGEIFKVDQLVAEKFLEQILRLLGSNPLESNDELLEEPVRFFFKVIPFLELFEIEMLSEIDLCGPDEI